MQKFLEACLAFADNAKSLSRGACSPARGQRMCRECGWGTWMRIPGGAAAAGLPTPCMCSGLGEGKEAQPRMGVPPAAQLCSSVSSCRLGSPR